MPPIAIEYRRIGLLATCLGNERIRIALDGRVSHARNTAECRPGEVWSAPWHLVGTLDPPALSQLREDIIGSGLPAVAGGSIDDRAEGGTREEIDLTLDGRDYHIVVQNADVAAFRQVVTLLWGVMFRFSR